MGAPSVAKAGSVAGRSDRRAGPVSVQQAQIPGGTRVQLVRLNHLHLHVCDVGQDREFCKRWFGFEEEVQHGPILFSGDRGGLDLALASDPDSGPMPSWFHFGFRLDSIGDVAALYDAMLEAGVEMRQPFEDWGDLAAFRCVDEDGYQIEVYWE